MQDAREGWVPACLVSELASPGDVWLLMLQGSMQLAASGHLADAPASTSAVHCPSNSRVAWQTAARAVNALLARVWQH